MAEVCSGDAQSMTPRYARRRWPGTIDDDRWGNRTRINANRLRAGYWLFLTEFDWQLAAALTFAVANGLNEHRASMEAFRWCKVLAWLSRYPIGWAYAVEGGGGRRLHAHVLLIGVPERCFDVGIGTWEARNGSAQLTPVHDRVGASNYLCKEIGANEVVLSDTLTRYRK